MSKQTTEEELAKLFHDTYERLSPKFGYETRLETRKFDKNSPNGRLMIAVCEEVMHIFTAELRGKPITMSEAEAHRERGVIENYTEWLHKHGYIDSDYYTEEPSPIDEFLTSIKEK